LWFLGCSESFKPQLPHNPGVWQFALWVSPTTFEAVSISTKFVQFWIHYIRSTQKLVEKKICFQPSYKFTLNICSSKLGQY
jgi:hypothetical protein